MTDTESRTALLAGANGLTGSLVLDALLEAPDVGRVVALSRRPLPRSHPRLANRIVQFEQLESQLKGQRCDVALCCLGTTLRKAGSQEAFRAVDLECVLTFARAALEAGARRFIVISSAAADPASKNFYLRTKGEMEAGLQALQPPALDILQPSLLLGGSRGETRPLELLASLIVPLVNPLLRGNWISWRAIPARVVAQAMLGATRLGRRGVQRYTYEGIRSLAQAASRVRPPAPPRGSSTATR
jgi:uncharacterized protein YbjT (DUF2867 family)